MVPARGAVRTRPVASPARGGRVGTTHPSTGEPGPAATAVRTAAASTVIVPGTSGVLVGSTPTGRRVHAPTGRAVTSPGSSVPGIGTPTGLMTRTVPDASTGAVRRIATRPATGTPASSTVIDVRLEPTSDAVPPARIAARAVRRARGTSSAERPATIADPPVATVGIGPGSPGISLRAIGAATIDVRQAGIAQGGPVGPTDVRRDSGATVPAQVTDPGAMTGARVVPIVRGRTAARTGPPARTVVVTTGHPSTVPAARPRGATVTTARVPIASATTVPGAIARRTAEIAARLPVRAGAATTIGVRLVTPRCRRAPGPTRPAI